MISVRDGLPYLQPLSGRDSSEQEGEPRHENKQVVVALSFDLWSKMKAALGLKQPLVQLDDNAAHKRRRTD